MRLLLGPELLGPTWKCFRIMVPPRVRTRQRAAVPRAARGATRRARGPSEQAQTPYSTLSGCAGSR
eukprot:3535173-Prymnesium_polylepis.1